DVDLRAGLQMVITSNSDRIDLRCGFNRCPAIRRQGSLHIIHDSGEHSLSFVFIDRSAVACDIEEGSSNAAIHPWRGKLPISCDYPSEGRQRVQAHTMGIDSTLGRRSFYRQPDKLEG